MPVTAVDPADGKRGLVAAVRADCMPVADNLPGASLYRFELQQQRLVLTVQVQPNAKSATVAGRPMALP